MDQDATTQLVEAIENDDWDESAQLLKAGGCNVNAKTRDFGHSLLQAAAQHGALEVCQLLLAQQADVNAADGSKTTPLISCVIGGENDEIVSILLKAKASASHQAYDGSTAMSWAKRLQRKQVMRVLKKAGFTKQDSTNNMAPFESQVGSERCESDASLAQHSDLAAQTQYLVEAVESHQWDEVTKVLLVEGCNVNARTLDFGHTLLQEAAQHGALEVCQLLVGQRAEVNAVDGTKTTPLMSCVIGGDNGEIVSLLLEARADASIQSYNGFTVSQVASRLRRTKAIELLGKASITDSTQSCATAQETNNEATKPTDTEPATAKNTGELIQAVEDSDWKEAVKLLAAGGCDVNARTRDFGHSLLQEAASHNATHVCELLLAQRADVNGIDGSRTTPLMSCIINGDHPRLVKMLLHARADTSMEAYDGSTALKWARRLHRHKVVDALKKGGALLRIKSTSSSNLGSFPLIDVQEEEQEVKQEEEQEVKQPVVADNTPQLIEYVENDAWDEAADILQAGSCNVNARTLDFGHSMLQEAAQHGAVDVCQLLLAMRAEVNAVDGSNTTALTSCILGGDYGEIVSLLLDAKADVSIATQDGSTPGTWAKKLRRKTIIDILKKATPE